jgi:hypothetical protein
MAFVLTSGFGLIGFFIAVVVNLFIIKQVYETFWDRAVAMWIITSRCNVDHHNHNCHCHSHCDTIYCKSWKSIR